MEKQYMDLKEMFSTLAKELTQLKKNQKESRIDVLFLIGMSKEQSNNVFCEKEIVKIQRILKEKKMGTTISIAKTKKSFKLMLTHNPKIIHVICHGIKEIINENADKSRLYQEKYRTFLEIEDQKGDRIKLTGQKLIGLIEKCNCYPELIILNSCHSQEIYEDMKRVSDKICNTLSVKGDFPINNVYAYKFILAYYQLFLNSIIEKQKINWFGILEQTKQQINQIQVRAQLKWGFICCDRCKFTECFETERNMSYSDFQRSPNCKHLLKNIREEEFDFLKQFVLLHLYDENNKRIENCYKTQNYQSESIQSTSIKNRAYLLLCSSFFKQFQSSSSSNLKSKVTIKYLQKLIDEYDIPDIDKKKSELFLLVIKFMKHAFLQAERYTFHPDKISTQLSLSKCQDRGCLVTTHGTDFLTTPYPKLSKGISYKEQFDQIQELEQKQKCVKVSLNRNFLQHNKGIMLKYLQDKIVKSTNFSPQIHIFNLKNIKSIEDFKRIYLTDIKLVCQYIDQQSKDFHMFYFYRWCLDQETEELESDFFKGKCSQAKIYFQTEKESSFDKFIFCIQEMYDTQIRDKIINNDGKVQYDPNNRFIKDKYSFNETEKLYDKFKVDIKNTHNLFHLLIQLKQQLSSSESSEDNIFFKIIDIFKNNQLERQRERYYSINSDKDQLLRQPSKENFNLTQGDIIQNINQRLLFFVNQDEHPINKPLYKYLYKQTMMNNLSPLKFIHKISLTRCLLKNIIALKKDTFQNITYFQLLGALCKESRDSIDIKKSLLSLSSIYKTFGFQHYSLIPQFRDLTRSIILNEIIPLNTELIKAYLIGLKFSKNSYKTFRDIIKIHKRVMLVKENPEQIQEIELLLNYLKVKYYFRNAKENPKYLNLYYISNIFKNSLKKTQTELSMILFSRIIIRMIVLADKKEGNMNDLSTIIFTNYKQFQNAMIQIYDIKHRKKIDQSDQDQIDKKKYLNQILIYSTILSELVKLMSKIVIPKSSQLKLEKSKSKDNSVNYQNDDNDYQMLQKNIQCSQYLKIEIQNVRKLYEKVQAQEQKEILNQFENSPEMIEHQKFCLTSYYKLELQIEESSFQPTSKKDSKGIFEDQTTIYLSSDKIITIVNEYQKQEPTSISQTLVQKIENSLLSVQYYFRSSQMKLNGYINYSIELGKYIQNISNRTIFTTKLLTQSNVQQISKIQQKVKKIVIIDEENQAQDILQYYPEIESIQRQKQSSEQILVELLIVLNTQKQYTSDQYSIFKEKRLIYLDISKLQYSDPAQLKILKNQFIRNLFLNILKDKEVIFSQATFSSIKEIPSNLIGDYILINQFKDSIHFKLHDFKNNTIETMQHQNFQSGSNNDISLKEVSQEDINAYFYQLSLYNIDLSKGSNSQLKEIFGRNNKLSNTPKPSQMSMSNMNIDDAQTPLNKDFYQEFDNNQQQMFQQLSQQDDNNNDTRKDIDRNDQNYISDEDEDNNYSSQIQSSHYQFLSRR